MTERVALVTGGGSGIGRAISRSLGNSGHLVIVTDIDADGAESTRREIVSGNGKAVAVTMDVTSPDSVASTIAGIIDEHAGIHVLVNCAGWDALMPFVDTDEAFWERIIGLNFKAVLRTTHAVLPHMIERQWGRLINIGSDAGRVGSSLEAVYSGAKGGVIAFTKTIAREVARKGVTANCVCPGPTQTRLLDEIAAAGDDGERVLDAMARSVPMKRLGTPEDVAAVVDFLATDEAGYVTGQTISVSGGLTMA